MTKFGKKLSLKLQKLGREQLEQLLTAKITETDFFNSIFESLSTGLIICDSEFHVMLANKSAKRYIPFSVPLSESINRKKCIWEIISDKDIQDFILNTSLHQKNNISKEFTLETSGGSIRFIEINLIPFIQSHKLMGNIITVDDITEKRNQEILLRRMENLTNLTTVAANLAHDIKNPLGSISIHIQLLQKIIQKARNSDNLLPEEKYIEDRIDIINDEIGRLNGIVVDFLYAVRPVNPEFKLVNPNEILTHTLDFCLPELKEKNITLETDIISNSPRLLLDEKLFRQIILNLVQNAQAALVGTEKIIKVATKIQNDKFLFIFADNGIGMDKKTEEKIFEPYFTTKTTGTGLGLTMVYKIIKEFGGDIQVQSILEKGTVFTISLPIPQREKKLLEFKQ